MRHVFVETNWVVGYAAPAHHRVPEAVELLERAARGKLRLLVPTLAISEARKKIVHESRFGPRTEAKAMREFIRWGLAEGTLTRPDADAARRVVQAMERRVAADRADLPSRLEALRRAPGVEVFGMSDAMLERTIGMASEDIVLAPFDQSILAAVLVRGGELATAPGVSEVCFATLDRDLVPWDKAGGPKRPLVDWYDAARVWVYGDFTLSWPEPPDSWRER